ncbi:putative disease resistance protein RGA4 [Andrographis paniculata]|uniref:putative disease resistance protein RGA4 n=1 Tax=Andrographis paniculata TaxID=175694 RepID=UPI0021E88761|nr:putative disease resistance protein RGA4 [Andrographis paniculata]
MADALLSVVLENLSSLIKGEIGLIVGVDDEMKKLASNFTAIQAVLEDAEKQQLESQAIRDWLIKLTDLTYEIDDVLDECATQVSKQKLKTAGWKWNPLPGLKNILFRDRMGRRMKQLAERLDQVAAERDKFHLRNMEVTRPSYTVHAERETGAVLNNPDNVYGREAETEKIVHILVNDVKDNQELSILPIVGLGGLGKTTIAQLVFQDPRVVEHFDKKLWVCVSDDFDQKTLLKAMIEYATGSSMASDLMHLGSLEGRIFELLSKRRYLLVLDDVWNDDQEKWFKLKNVLTCGSPGSAIIVTTRQKKVAEIMGTLPEHNLKELSEDHCWLLFKQRAFRQGEEIQFPELEAIGKQIVKKCCGLPLAAKVLGGLLRFKRTENEWLHVKESELWDLPEEETSILPSLRLSYHHLPLALRQCFAYCSIFPKDSKIYKQDLILLWMAHGYISSKGDLEVEDVGEQIWNELILRSLFQNPIDDEGNPSIDSVTLHDIVHDLAQSIMENKVSRTHLGSSSNSKIREVNLSKHQVAFPKRKQLEMDICFVLANYRRLRVLDASFEVIEKFPSNIGKLKHLRSLDLSGSDIYGLPDSFCSLWHLKILVLKYCQNLVRLPKKMRNLKNLRHLFLEGCHSLRETPIRIGELTRLRTLEIFIVGCNKGNHLEELEFLNLGGELEIRHLERVENPLDAMKANLAEKHNLSHLFLKWEIDNASKLGGDHKDENVLEALQPSPNIEKFGISGFRGRHFPNWMTNLKMDKLVTLVIRNCQNLLDLFQMVEMPHLKSLYLENLSKVEYIVSAGNATKIIFPSLEDLEFDNVQNLKGFFKEEVEESCPNLQTLIVCRCPSLVLPELSQLKKLKKLACDSSLSLASFSKLENLNHLSVRIAEDMKFIPHELLECFPNLENLGIWNADEHCISMEVLQGLNSLKFLGIYSSEKLTCLPGIWFSHATTLEHLYVESCANLVDLPMEIKYVDTIREVTLSNLPKMVCIPEAIRHLSSLQNLNLGDLQELTSLPEWLGDLTTLRHLFILSCPKLASLPSCIQRMTNIQSLYVIFCPKIHRRCKEGIGEDWHKIAHIPNLDIK